MRQGDRGTILHRQDAKVAKRKERENEAGTDLNHEETKSTKNEGLRNHKDTKGTKSKKRLDGSAGRNLEG